MWLQCNVGFFAYKLIIKPKLVELRAQGFLCGQRALRSIRIFFGKQEASWHCGTCGTRQREFCGTPCPANLSLLDPMEELQTIMNQARPRCFMYTEYLTTFTIKIPLKNFPNIGKHINIPCMEYMGCG